MKQPPPGGRFGEIFYERIQRLIADNKHEFAGITDKREWVATLDRLLKQHPGVWDGAVDAFFDEEWHKRAH